jgi:hypothetical protein
MKYLLETLTNERIFICNAKIYSPVNGVAMGSPLGPLFADIYINDRQNKSMTKLKNNGLMSWKRCVDDTFAVVNNRNIKETNNKSVKINLI